MTVLLGTVVAVAVLVLTGVDRTVLLGTVVAVAVLVLVGVLVGVLTAAPSPSAEA